MDRTAPQPDFLRSLVIQTRVIGALVMREIITRYGRHNIGFMWVFVEPMMFTGGVLGMLDPRFNHAWIVFGVFTTTVWLAGGAAAVLLSMQQRRERRLA